MADPDDVWTEQQAREFQAASDALHQAMTAEPSSRARQTADEGSLGEREAAEARFRAIREELEAAQFAKDRAGILLMQIGLGGAACCVALLILSRGS